jgi:TetR/AcrR family transcriptional regulator, fatty acid biosynthesis regulator
MTRKVQARTMATRDKLMAAGREIVAVRGMAELRTEEVVLKAGTAKGTFFAHFPDRDHFLAALLAADLTAEFAGLAAPEDRKSLSALLDRLFHRFARDADTVALLARFSGPAGEGLGLDLIICQVIERLAEGVAKLQAQHEAGNRAASAVLGEALMAMVFHAAASAQCSALGDPQEVRTLARRLLHQMVEALVWPTA